MTRDPSTLAASDSAEPLANPARPRGERRAHVGAVAHWLPGGGAGFSRWQRRIKRTRRGPRASLVVGSSFTSDGYEADLDVPSKVAYLAASADPPRAIEFDRQVAGGATLIGHANNTLTMRKIREGGFDIVVVQGDIAGSPMETTDMFTLGLAALVPEIEASGAEAVLYMTWPWPPGSWTSLDFIAETHRQAEAEHCSAVAPVGIAMADATAERPGLPVIGWDREHQDLRGAYLAAATIYSTLFGESPEGLPYRPDGVSEKDAEFLQRIAWEAVQEWSADKASE